MAEQSDNDRFKNLECYEGEQVAVLPYTAANLTKVFNKLGRNLWKF